MRYRTLALFALGYLASAPASAADTESIARSCNNCHGTGGVSVGMSMRNVLADAFA